MSVLMRSVLIGAALSCSGCAYLTTYTRSIDLDGTSSVAMDVKQRVVISQIKKSEKEGGPSQVVTCAEPSPDALTVLGLSGGLSFSDGASEKAANLSGALTESGAFVGLRTQSIQLLRDAMYRLCEGYAAGAVDDRDFAGMQRRYQSTMMGLIAIEQLTRPVVASQAVLVSAASSGAGAGADDAGVKQAQSRADDTDKAVLAAKDESRRADADLAEARAAVDKKDAEIAVARSEKEKNTERIGQLEGERPALVKAVDDAGLKKQAAADKLQMAEESKRAADADLLAARTRVTALAAGGGSAAVALSDGLSNVAKELVFGVKDIVQEINASYTKEGCFSLIRRVIEEPDLRRELQAAGRTQADKPINPLAVALEMCDKILTTESQIRLQEARTNAALKLAEQERQTAQAAQRSRAGFSGSFAPGLDTPGYVLKLEPSRAAAAVVEAAKPEPEAKTKKKPKD